MGDATSGIGAVAPAPVSDTFTLLPLALIVRVQLKGPGCGGAKVTTIGICWPAPTVKLAGATLKPAHGAEALPVSVSVPLLLNGYVKLACEPTGTEPKSCAPDGVFVGVAVGDEVGVRVAVLLGVAVGLAVAG